MREKKNKSLDIKIEMERVVMLNCIGVLEVILIVLDWIYFSFLSLYFYANMSFILDFSGCSTRPFEPDRLEIET